MIKPFGKNLLIEYREVAQYAGSNVSLTQIGKVIAIGDEVQKIKVGDTLATTVWGVNGAEVDGKMQHIIPEDDRFILFKLENEG